MRLLLLVPAGVTARIVTAGGGQYGAHALGTGERLWTHKGLAPAIVASPVVSGDTVVGFGYGYGYDSTPPFSETLAFASDRGKAAQKIQFLLSQPRGAASSLNPVARSLL